MFTQCCFEHGTKFWALYLLLITHIIGCIMACIFMYTLLIVIHVIICRHSMLLPRP